MFYVQLTPLTALEPAEALRRSTKIKIAYLNYL